MARFEDHNKALILRKEGMSYSQIKNTLNVSKSTLSCWLRKYPLSKERISELRDTNEQRIERFRETMRQKKDKRLACYYQQQKKLIFPIKKRELFICGLFLYWGEGSKGYTIVGVSNTDPAMIRFFIKWLTVCFAVPRSRLSAQLQLYSDMDVEKEINFWSDSLDIPRCQFIRPYIKENFRTQISHKGGFGHGTCNLRVCDARMSEMILMAIKSIADEYT